MRGCYIKRALKLDFRRNAYLCYYCSNESPVDVFFDNLQVVHTKGALLEETHYYPFGLTMAAISSKAAAFGQPSNKLKYNGKEEQRGEFSDGSGLELLGFGKRMYDNQIGRWHLVDPLAEKYQPISPYSFTSNNPIIFVDKDGKDIKPGDNWKGSAYENTYNKLYQQSSFKQLTVRFEGTKDRNVTLNLRQNDPKGKQAYARTSSNATETSVSSEGEFFVAGNHNVNIFENESINLNGAALNSLGQAAVITHELLHANSYYETDNNLVRNDWGVEATLAYGGYMEKMQGVLKDFVKANGIEGVSDLDIKAISTIGIGIQDDQGNIITEVADVVGEYSKTVLEVTLDTTAKDYGEKLADAYKTIKDDVTKRLLIDNTEKNNYEILLYHTYYNCIIM